MRSCRLLHAVCWLVCALPGRLAGQAVAGSATVPAAATDTTAPPRGPRKTVGAEVGYSRTNLGGGDARRLGSRQGALTGVYLQVPLGARLSIRPEVLFALKGGLAEAQVDGSPVLDVELAYIEMPVLLRATPLRGRVRPVLFAGPAPGLQIGCDLQLVDPSTPTRVPCQNTAVGDFRGFDVGFVGGAGIEMRWPQSALALEARYTTGLRSVLDGVDVRNQGVGVLLALTF